TDAIKSTLRFTAAGREIKRAVRSELHVGHVERLALHEILEGSRVTGALRFQMNRDDSSVSPVHDVKRPLVFLRPVRSSAELHACWRADANIDHWRERVMIPLRPFRCSFAKTVVAAGDQMINANGPVPWHAPIPFHVAVERKHFA